MAEERPTRASIQDEINFQLSAAGKKMRSFVLKDKNGECVVPENVHIRFYGCEFDSFDAGKSNNNFYFRGCKFRKAKGSYVAKNATIIFDGCTFDGKFVLEASKAEMINNCVVYQGVFISKKGSLTSVRTNFQGETKDGNSPDRGVDLDTGARFDSTLDIYKGWVSSVFRLKAGSAAIIRKPIISAYAKNLATLTSSYMSFSRAQGDLEITGSDSAANLFNLDKSKVELASLGKLTSTKTIFLLNHSVLTVKDVGDIKAGQGNVIDSDASIVEIHLPGAISSTTGPTIKAKLSKISIYTEKSFSGGSSGDISSDGSVITITSNGVSQFKSNSGSTVESSPATRSKIILRNLNSLKSSSGAGLSFENADVLIEGIQNISGTSPAAILGVDSAICIKDVQTIESTGGPAIRMTGNTKSSLLLENVNSVHSSQTGIVLSKKTSAILHNVAQIRGDQKGISVGTESACQLVVKGVTNILGNQSDGITVGNGSNVLLKNVTLVKGTNVGINGGNARGSRISLEGVGQVEGGDSGISLVDGDLSVIGSDTLIKGGNNGIVATSGSEGSYSINMSGPLRVQGASQAISAVNYKIETHGVTWLGGVSITAGLWKSSLHNTTGKTALTQVSADLRRTQSQGDVSIAEKTDLSMSLSKMERLNLQSGSSAFVKSSEVAGVGTIQKSSFLGLRTKAEGSQTNATDGFFGLLGGSFTSFRPGGKSTALLGAVSGGDLSFALDSIQSPVAALTAGGGDLEIQADSTLYLAAMTLDAKLRARILMAAQTTAQITSIGTMSLDSQANFTAHALADVIITGDALAKLQGTQVYV